MHALCVVDTMVFFQRLHAAWLLLTLPKNTWMPTGLTQASSVHTHLADPIAQRQRLPAAHAATATAQGAAQRLHPI
jgi:hypothetical protein